MIVDGSVKADNTGVRIATTAKAVTVSLISSPFARSGHKTSGGLIFRRELCLRRGKCYAKAYGLVP